MVKKYIPKQGDVVLISFNPTKGHEQKGSRPAVVISATEYNSRSGMMLVCPVTSKGKGYVFEVAYSGTKIKGFILVDQIRSMDWYTRQPKFIEKCSPEKVSQIRLLVASLIQG
jgi:mRNA interferase MazF